MARAESVNERAPGPRIATAAAFEVWLDVRWRTLSKGDPYVEYGQVLGAESRVEAERIARDRPGALIFERESGEVWEPLR